jgi:hypothetical protein
MIATQLGRRNLTPGQKSYLRGKRYNLEKRQDGGHGDQKSGDQNDLPTTAQRLGEEYGVGEATIKRDAAFANAVDTLEDQVRADIRETILKRQRKQYAAEVGRLFQKMRADPNAQNLDLSWWNEFWKSLGITEQTLRNWWNAFCQESGFSLTPSQALAIHKEQFFAWLEEQNRKAAEEKARKSVEERAAFCENARRVRECEPHRFLAHANRKNDWASAAQAVCGRGGAAVGQIRRRWPCGQWPKNLAR